MLYVLFLQAWMGMAPPAPQSNPPDKPAVRACPDNWNDSLRGKMKAPSNKKKNAPVKSGACIELAFSPLDIQEYLQSYSRRENWGITDDQLTQDSWMFSLELSKEELLRDTLPESLPKGIEWTGGSVRVHVNTVLLPDGVARTTVRAMFRGYGKAADQFAMQKEYWELDSSDVFENSIVAALRTYFVRRGQPSP